MGGRSALRYLAAAVGLLFLAGTVFQLLDQLNLVAQPPSVPDTANLVDRVTAYFPYRQSIWPIFLLANGLVGLAFLTLTGLGIALARRVARTDDRGTVLLWTLVTAGLLGGVAQVLLVGEVKATIDIPYCDCGFKNEEIVSQVWAEMLIQSAVQLVVQVAALFAAAGVVVAARLFGGGAMPSAWAWLSYLVAAVVLVTAILAVAGPDSLYDLGQWLTNLLTGVLIPVWALWLALRFSEPVVTADAASDRSRTG